MPKLNAPNCQPFYVDSQGRFFTSEGKPLTRDLETLLEAEAYLIMAPDKFTQSQKSKERWDFYSADVWRQWDRECGLLRAVRDKWPRLTSNLGDYADELLRAKEQLAPIGVSLGLLHMEYDPYDVEDPLKCVQLSLKTPLLACVAMEHAMLVLKAAKTKEHAALKDVLKSAKTNLESKRQELMDCQDSRFVAKSLSPLEASHDNAMKALKEFEAGDLLNVAAMFEKLGLKETYELWCSRFGTGQDPDSGLKNKKRK